MKSYTCKFPPDPDRHIKQDGMVDQLTVRAHKAANPEKYPVRDDVRAMMPYYEGIEARYEPSKVHLQVYDGV